MSVSTAELTTSGRPRGVKVIREIAALPVIQDRTSWLIATVAVVVGLIFLAVDLSYNHGRLAAPLDDVYIHLQYARNIGTGHFFEIDPGDAVSTGASSTLYALFLGFFYFVGIHGNALLAFAMLMGVCFWAISSALICQLGTALVARSVGIWSGVLVAISGGLAWTSTSGMEVGMVMALFTGTLLAAAYEMPSRRYRFTPVLALLLALARPEGAIFAVVLCGGQWWTLWRGRGRCGRRFVLTFAAWSLLPIGAYMAQLVFYKLATGTTAATGLQAKSLFYVQPVFFLWPFIDSAVITIRSYVAIFSGFTDQDYMFPGASLVFAGGLTYLLASRPPWRVFWIAVTVGLLGIILSLSTMASASEARLRYLAPFIPMYILVIVSGCYGLSRISRDPQVRRWIFGGAILVPVAFAAMVLPTWGMWFGQNSEAIDSMDVRLALWLRNNIPHNSIVAVKDLGAISYYSGHRVVDLVGLGTEGLAIPDDQGAGSLYEALIHMPKNQRPTIFAAYDSVPGVAMIPFEDVGLLRTPAIATLPGRLPLLGDGGSIVPFAELDVYKTDWSVVDAAPAQHVPGQLKDHLTIGYLASEKAHNYEPEMAEDGIEPTTILSRVGNSIEAGRLIIGGEGFTVHNLTSGKPLTITAHIGVNTGSAPAEQVLADGKVVGVLKLTPGAKVAWMTYRFTIPARFVRGSSLRIELRDPPATSTGTYQLNQYPDYNSYGYWFSQP